MSHFPSAFITREKHAHDEPIDLLTDMHFIGFIASSACVREIMEHADEVSKLLGGNCVTLVKMLSTENLSKQRFRATDGHRK